MKKVLTGFFWLVILGWIGHTTSQYFVMNPEKTKFFIHKWQDAFAFSDTWHLLLNLHIATACLAILAGALGFITSGAKKWKPHRTLGMIYVSSVMFSALISFYLATQATGGLISVVGFFVLDILWITSTYLSYRYIRQKNGQAHKMWSYRSYAFTLANITLHLLLNPLSDLAGGYVEGYRLSVWLCWMLNLAVAEVLIRGTLRKQKTLASR